MDLRETEKEIFTIIYVELQKREWHNLYDSIKNAFVDNKQLDSDAKRKRFEIAMDRVRKKVYDKSSRYNH